MENACIIVNVAALCMWSFIYETLHNSGNWLWELNTWKIGERHGIFTQYTKLPSQSTCLYGRRMRHYVRGTLYTKHSKIGTVKYWRGIDSLHIYMPLCYLYIICCASGILEYIALLSIAIFYILCWALALRLYCRAVEKMTTINNVACCRLRDSTEKVGWVMRRNILTALKKEWESGSICWKQENS